MGLDCVSCGFVWTGYQRDELVLYGAWQALSKIEDVALTCATGGMANFRDGPGTPSAKSISSCSVKPSFWAYAGRLYFATSVSMVTSTVVYASEEMDFLNTRGNGDETEKAAGVGDGGVVKAGDEWVGRRDDEVDERVDGLAS